METEDKMNETYNPTNQPPASSAAQTLAVSYALGVVGALIGAIVSFYLYRYTLQFGMVFMALPGALAGLGCGYLSKIRSIPLGIVAAIVSIAAAIFMRYSNWVLVDQHSFGHYLSNGIWWSSMSGKLMIGTSGLFGFWLGIGRQRR